MRDVRSLGRLNEVNGSMYNNFFNGLNAKETNGKGVFPELDALLPEGISMLHLDSFNTKSDSFASGWYKRFQGVFFIAATFEIIEIPFDCKWPYQVTQQQEFKSYTIHFE